VRVSPPWSLASLGAHLRASPTPPSVGDGIAPVTPSILWPGGWSSKPSFMKPSEETRAEIHAIYALHRPNA
jgi:hypothetical protein